MKKQNKNRGPPGWKKSSTYFPTCWVYIMVILIPWSIESVKKSSPKTIKNQQIQVMGIENPSSGHRVSFRWQRVFGRSSKPLRSPGSSGSWECSWGLVTLTKFSTAKLDWISVPRAYVSPIGVEACPFSSCSHFWHCTQELIGPNGASDTKHTESSLQKLS